LSPLRIRLIGIVEFMSVRFTFVVYRVVATFLSS
jgi:hypothetical protein